MRAYEVPREVFEVVTKKYAVEPERSVNYRGDTYWACDVEIFGNTVRTVGILAKGTCQEFILWNLPLNDADDPANNEINDGIGVTLEIVSGPEPDDLSMVRAHFDITGLYLDGRTATPVLMVLTQAIRTFNSICATRRAE